MDDFNEGNNFDDDYYRDDDDSSILDDISDVKDSAKDLKSEYKKYKSRNSNADGALKDNGKAFRENMRASNNSRSAINPASESVVTNSTTTGASAAGVETATGGTAAGGAAAGGAATEGAAAGGAAAEGAAAGGAVAEGAAAGGAAAGGAAAGGTAAGGAAAGGAAAGGAAAGGAAAGGAAAGASATGIGAIVVAAIGLLMALKNLGDKLNKKIEELTGTDTKKMTKYLLIGSVCFIFLIIILASALFTVSNTAYDDLDQLIKRREKRYGKSLIMFTDSEYDELINKDYNDDNSYNTILKSYGNDLGTAFLVGLDTKHIYDDKTLSKKDKEEKLVNLESDEVKKYLKAQRENFNKIIWNASSGYNSYTYKSSQSYTDFSTYSSDKSGKPQLSSSAATISGGASYSDPNTHYWEIYKKYNQGLSMYEIKDNNGKETGLKIPEIVLEGEANKDDAASYYVDLLEDYLQKWVIPYTMMIDSQDKDFIDRVMKEMYHRVDVNVYKLSKETKNTTTAYYMKAIKKVHYQEYTIYDDDSKKSHYVAPNTFNDMTYENLNTRDYPLGTTKEDKYLGRVTKNGRSGSRYLETTTYIELDPSNEKATNPDGSPMVKEIKVNRNISAYKNVPKVVNTESFYDIVREQYKITPIDEKNPANVTSAINKQIDQNNGILTESYDETWYEELEQVGQTEKKGYSVSYYTDEQVKNLGRKISRVEWAQDYGNKGTSASTIDNSRIFPTKTDKDLQDANKKYGNGKGYSYDDLYFAYYHIGQYYTELNGVNGNSTDSSNGGAGLGWPVDIKKYPNCKVINCFYGYTPAYGESHGGTDISAGGYVTGSTLHVGPEVIAAHDGKVVAATGNPNSDADEYTYVEILADDGKMKTQYGHLSKIFVKNGQKVKKGDVIGKMGTTGQSTGTHLHFAMFINGSRTDPMNYYILAKEGSNKEVDYSKIDKNTITSLPTGYVFYKEKGGSSSQIIKFISSWEFSGTPPMDASKTKYKIYTGPEGNRVIGYGLDLDAGGYATTLKNAGYGTSVGDLVDKDFIDNLYLKEIDKNYRSGVIKRTQGLNLKDFQIDALTSRAYNCGNEGALGSNGGFSSFSAAYKQYWNDTDFKTSADYNHPLYTNYMSTPITADGVVMPGLITRRKSEWKLFQTGVYDSSH